MDLLDSFQGIAAWLILLATMLVLIVAVFMPKQRKGEVLRKIGRWFQGF
jgi:hypothetical protein